MAGNFVTPVEVVTKTGKLRHAAYIEGEARENKHGVAAELGVCGRAKGAARLVRVDWLRECGNPVDRWPICRACWRQVAIDEGVTA